MQYFIFIFAKQSYTRIRNFHIISVGAKPFLSFRFFSLCFIEINRMAAATHKKAHKTKPITAIPQKEQVNGLINMYYYRKKKSKTKHFVLDCIYWPR